MPHSQLVILYHNKCVDGFGGAYAAWKKYGDSVEYIPVAYGKPLPEHLEGRDLILVDFCYEQPEMDALKAVAKSIVVLDHHAGVEGVATQFEGVFNTERSGSTLAWEYFHPGTPIPRLLEHLEDGDNYRFALPDTRDIFSYLDVTPYDFAVWDTLVADIESEEGRAKVLAKARIYDEYFKLLAESSVNSAKLIRFENYECHFAASHPSMTMKSYVGHELYTKKPPIALVVTAHPDGFGVSIRGDGSVDVAEIARKYGGNGHKNSAGFFVPAGTPPPWVEIKS